MRTRLLSTLSVALLAGALILTGCAKGTQTPVDGPAAAANAKPPLEIPASFTDEAAKRDFAVKAMKDGYYKEAKALLEEGLAAEPNVNAYRYLGAARYNLKDYAGAIEAWSKAAELDPTSAGEMKNNIGNALRDNKKVDEAKTAYREALELDPTRWNAAANLASLLHQEGATQDAIGLLDQAIEVSTYSDPLIALRDSLLNQAQAPNNG